MICVYRGRENRSDVMSDMLRRKRVKECEVWEVYF